jgi:hypothetical protein
VRWRLRQFRRELDGTSTVAILKLLGEVGAAWSFVGAKEKNIAPAEKGLGSGDAWTWTGICADTKLVPFWRVGGRDADTAYVL